jgi:hypothetical protein
MSFYVLNYLLRIYDRVIKVDGENQCDLGASEGEKNPPFSPAGRLSGLIFKPRKFKIGLQDYKSPAVFIPLSLSPSSL